MLVPATAPALAAGPRTERVSVSTPGHQATGCWVFSKAPAISADGRYVVFGSNATNLVPGDTNAAMDVFVRDVVAGTTVRANVTSDGGQSKGEGTNPAARGGGRGGGLLSAAAPLGAGDTNNGGGACGGG